MAVAGIRYDRVTVQSHTLASNRDLAMDAGVLQLHVFPHEPAANRPKLLADGELILPTITPSSPITRTAPVSLVIPTFFNNRLKNGSLHYLLDGLDASDTIEEVILVVSDEADEDGKQYISLSPSKRAIHVPCDRNQRARARNMGAAVARHELLLFLDDDMVLDSWKTIDVLVSRLLTEQYDCALFPRRHYARFPLLYDQAALESSITRWRTEDLDESLVFDPVRHGCPFKTMAFCFPGCFMLIRKAAFQLIGGFPSEFVGWGFEDTDFAMRAAAVLRVLNLFRKSQPLLHIDHPVSPYKSEEYETNFRKFLSAHSMSDVDRLCTHVIGGGDFLDGARPNDEKSPLLAPLKQLAESKPLLNLMTDALQRDVRQYYENLIESRLSRAYDAMPQYVVLCGSRAAGTATATSDFDVLFLFQSGMVREFFTCKGDTGLAIDFEFSDLGKFEGIAQRPVFFPLYGPLELEKLANSQLLFGNADDWQAWVDQQLSRAVQGGRAFWLSYALGMSLRKPKHGSLLAPFLAALRILFSRVDSSKYHDDLDLLDDFQRERLGPHLRNTLDAEHHGWRDDVANHRRTFAFQVPEVWSALRWLLNSDH